MLVPIRTATDVPDYTDHRMGKLGYFPKDPNQRPAVPGGLCPGCRRLLWASGCRASGGLPRHRTCSRGLQRRDSIRDGGVQAEV